ncbi:MAG: hypothetical protein K2M65_01385, partial [Muribaculaceae bacterium]|nr:hypothetical protein [Muribaculaceae bacterium]
TIGYGPGYTIYLKSGKTIKGKMVKVDGDDVKVFLDNMGIWRTYKMSRVEKIELESGWGSGPDAQTWSYSDSIPKGRSRGFVNVGYARWSDDIQDDPRKNSVYVNMSYGYQFNPNLYFGVGIGFDMTTETGIYMPMGLDLRCDLMRTPTSPFIDLRGGYTVSFDNWSGLGMFLHPSVGMRMFPCDRWPINISLGYMMQNLKGAGTINAVTISVGTAF